MRAVSVAVGFLFLVPALSTSTSAEDLLRVRLKANAQLTEAGTVTDLDASRWFDGRLVESDRDCVTVAINSAGEPARLRVPRWAITAFQIHRGRDRVGPAAIGGLVGLGIGLSVAGVACLSSDWACDGFMRPSSFTVPVGLAIGLAIGRTKWESVPVDRAAPPRP